MMRSCIHVSVLRICIIGDELAPFVARLRAWDLEGEMGEPARSLGAVPVLDACRDLDDVTWGQALQRFALFLIPALAVDANDDLAAALLGVVDMPEIAAARLERDVADGQRVALLREDLEVRLAREVLGIGIVGLTEAEEAAAALRISGIGVDPLATGNAAQAFGQPA